MNTVEAESRYSQEIAELHAEAERCANAQCFVDFFARMPTKMIMALFSWQMMRQKAGQAWPEKNWQDIALDFYLEAKGQNA